MPYIYQISSNIMAVAHAIMMFSQYSAITLPKHQLIIIL